MPEDANAFRQWVNLYENKKRNNFWLDSICLPDYIASHINEFDFNPNGVTFYGFDQLTKQQTNLKKLLIDLKIYNEISSLTRIFHEKAASTGSRVSFLKNRGSIKTIKQRGNPEHFFSKSVFCS